jgi:hypothetical protein
MDDLKSRFMSTTKDFKDVPTLKTKMSSPPKRRMKDDKATAEKCSLILFFTKYVREEVPKLLNSTRKLSDFTPYMYIIHLANRLFYGHMKGNLKQTILSVSQGLSFTCHAC